MPAVVCGNCEREKAAWDVEKYLQMGRKAVKNLVCLYKASEFS